MTGSHGHYCKVHVHSTIARLAVLLAAFCLIVWSSRGISQTPPAASGQSGQSTGTGQSGTAVIAIENKMVTVDAERVRG